MAQSYLSLSELNSLVKGVLKQSLDNHYWLVAEISEIRENYSGHCYLEFIQKSDSSDNLIAKARANIWASTYRLLRPYFESSTGVSLSQGMKVLVHVSVEFHELYGYSLTISDIDPAYTLGDLEQKRAQTIQQLISDGVFDMNRELEIPLVPQRIAVISSETAAGYDDFISQLKNNDFGFVFYTCLFQAYMQGENAESSIINAFERIFNHQDYFDVVVIIRGGGSRAELSSFDSYDLSSVVCQFPLPVIAGIGHERDHSVVDMVSNVRVKTPTAAADLIIEKASEFLGGIEQMTETFIDYAENLITEKKHELELLSGQLLYGASEMVQYKKERLNLTGFRFASLSSKSFNDARYRLSNWQNKLIFQAQKNYQEKEKVLNDITKSLPRLVKSQISEQNEKIAALNRVLFHCVPENIFKKGFSITVHNGKILKSKTKVKEGDQLKTILSDGEIQSIIHNPKS